MFEFMHTCGHALVRPAPRARPGRARTRCYSWWWVFSSP